MASQYSDLLAQIVIRAGDVNPGTIESEFRRRVSQYMNIAKVWRTWMYFDMAASLPGATALAVLEAASTAADAAAAAAPTNVTLQQAAAEARAAKAIDPYFNLTRPLKSAGPPEVRYGAIANPVLRVTLEDRDVYPFWRLNPPTATGGVQTLSILLPYRELTTGAVDVRVNWTPLWDQEPATAVPDWIYERYGADILEYTLGCLLVSGLSKRGTREDGALMRANGFASMQMALCQANIDDPIPMSI